MTGPFLHPCHAEGCERLVTRSKLMCPAHWRRVPKDIQRRVYAAWRSRRMREWYEAAEDAKRAVASLGVWP